jgi:PAS domain S-box-containing protein
MPDALLVMDSSGAVVFANPQIEQLFGYASGAIVARSIDSLLPERFRAQYRAHLEGYTQASHARLMGLGCDLYGLRSDGSEFPVEISLSPTCDADRVLVLAVVRDVSDRRSVERELIAAREIADRASLAKSRFLATASHDLRQPLQALALLNGALRRLATDPDVTEALTHQEQAIGTMSRLLNALLDISKLESGRIRPVLSDFAVGSLFDELHQEFATLASHKGLLLQTETSGDIVHSDPALISQILRNLLSNAIKYTRRGRVLLRCAAESGICRIEVRDTGIGIPADQIAYIYDEFFQVGADRDEPRDGYGLGLSIVSRLVKLLGLALSVESHSGAGTCFRLEVPAGSACLNDRGRASEESTRTRRRPRSRILLVEDDAAVRDATRMLLRAEGYELSIAGSYREAMQMAAAHLPLDLLITDYHLAEAESGVQVLEALRIQYGCDLKAILVTGDTSSLVKEIASREHLRVASKPIKAEQLLSLIDELCGRIAGDGGAAAARIVSGCATPSQDAVITAR